MYKRHVNELQFENNLNNSLWNKIEFEYSRALMNNRNSDKTVDRDLKIIRIFISSTFKDFYNERDVLVKNVFPRLRKWCEEQGLFLVECDLRWGVPADATNLEAVSYCLDEIEKSREETNNHNFFLCLIGDRFGWVPSEEILLEKLKIKYDFIKDCSVTLMEIVHGVLRSGTENSLFMIRSKNILENIPKNHLKFYEESDVLMQHNVEELRNFIEKHFSKFGCVKDYAINYQSTITEPISGKERLVFSDFDEFSRTVEEYFKNQILNFKTKNKLSSIVEDESEDMIHKSHLSALNKNSLKRTSYIKFLSNKITNELSVDAIKNPIIIITGEAGSGKSTVMSNLIEYFLTEGNVSIFYHFSGSSNTSHSQSSILKRFTSYLNSVFNIKIDNSNEEELDFGALFTKDDIPKVMIFIDAVDELWDLDIVKQFPKFTTKNILLIISCLLDVNPDSFYSKLLAQDIFSTQVSLEKMDKIQLIDITNNYLNKFGKKLDSQQTDELMKFENSGNPLWLLSACEELRIHGDYSTLTKLIVSLPPSIIALNRMIINRLTRQDTTNVLKTLLQILVIARAGIWESLIKDILAAILELSEPICHSSWSDITWQLKGFLQTQSIPLPLIKLRHRVMKESIEEELAMSEEFMVNLHLKLSFFLEKVLDSAGNVYLSDYLYHLMKSNSRNRLMDFMRSRKSLTILSQTFIRSRIMMSMRCINPISHDKPNALMICIFCANSMSIFTVNKNSCFYCGNVVMSADEDSKLFPCSFHNNHNPKMINCCLCARIVSAAQGEFIRKCHTCKFQGNPRNCGIIVKENDILFKQQLNFSKSVYRIETLI